MHAATQHMLAVSELKAQRVSSSGRVLLLIMDLAKNLVLLSRSNVAMASAQELVASLAQKRLRMMQFFASGCKGSVES